MALRPGTVPALTGIWLYETAFWSGAARMTGLISWMGVVLILVACGWRLIGLTCSLADLALVHPVMTIWEMSAEL